MECEVTHNKYWLKCSSIENYLQYSLAALTPPPNYFWRAEEESGIMHYSSLFLASENWRINEITLFHLRHHT
jgi:hypothetical protein